MPLTEQNRCCVGCRASTLLRTLGLTLDLQWGPQLLRIVQAPTECELCFSKLPVSLLIPVPLVSELCSCQLGAQLPVVSKVPSCKHGLRSLLYHGSQASFLSYALTSFYWHYRSDVGSTFKELQTEVSWRFSHTLLKQRVLREEGEVFLGLLGVMLQVQS